MKYITNSSLAIIAAGIVIVTNPSFVLAADTATTRAGSAAKQRIHDYFENEIPKGLTAGPKFYVGAGIGQTFLDSGGDVVMREVFDPKGHLVRRAFYDKEGKLNGTKREWFSDGNLRSVTPYEDGLRSGHCLAWDDQGNVVADYTMDKGTGTEMTYYPDGAVASAQPYENGAEVGIYLQFYESGEIAAAFRYKKGQIDGFSKDYYPNGRLREFGQYKDGLLNGIGLRFDDDGKLREFPTFWLHGLKVTEERYRIECEKDKTLTPAADELDRYYDLPANYPDYRKEVVRPASRPADKAQ